MIGLKGIKKGIEFQMLTLVKTHNEGSYLSIDRSFFFYYGSSKGITSKWIRCSSPRIIKKNWKIFLFKNQLNCHRQEL
jgi:hypothetical protein